MKALLTVIRWTVSIPVLVFEWILKALLFVVLHLTLLGTLVLYPILGKYILKIKESDTYEYAKDWTFYPLAIKVYSAWC